MRRRNEKSKTEEKRTGERENGEIMRNRKKQGEVKGAFRNDGTKMEDREKTSVGSEKKNCGKYRLGERKMNAKEAFGR